MDEKCDATSMTESISSGKEWWTTLKKTTIFKRSTATSYLWINFPDWFYFKVDYLRDAMRVYLTSSPTKYCKEQFNCIKKYDNTTVSCKNWTLKNLSISLFSISDSVCTEICNYFVWFVSYRMIIILW